MVPNVVFEVVACAGAVGVGYAASSFLRGRVAERRRRAHAKGFDAESFVAEHFKLESRGLHVRVIRLVLKESLKPTFALPGCLRFFGFGGGSSGSFKVLAAKTGLSAAVTRAGFESSRVRLALAFFVIASVLGSVLSVEMAALLGLGGMLVGWFAVSRAFKAEMRARSERIGYQLGEMAEVVALGLRSGLSFDRAFALYCEHFDSAFAGDCDRARQQWTLGLVSRESALRTVAESYDSAMLSRVVEGIVRSLRFGTSLAETLEAAAVEARSIHKAEVEERVAKAPVKMLVPVGTLILPAMLVFVLGPIMVDLANGM